MPRPREDKSVRLSMTGEEFKTLIERFTDNGQIDTVPELMERVKKIPDEADIAEFIDSQTADDADIESLYDGEEAQQPVTNDTDGDGIDDSLIADDEDIESLYR